MQNHNWWIQKSERDSTRASTSQNWIGHYYTTSSSGQVQIKSKLCYNNQTRYRQVVSGWIHSICRRGYIVVAHVVIVPKKNGKLRICIDFKKLNVATKKDPYPLPFTDEMLNTVIGYEAYFFLDRYLGYHQIFIAPEDRYKTTFVINWGGFYMEGDVVWC
jgi:hypothetical protein